jgi:hypothetical protein
MRYISLSNDKVIVRAYLRTLIVTKEYNIHTGIPFLSYLDYCHPELHHGIPLNIVFWRVCI